MGSSVKLQFFTWFHFTAATLKWVQAETCLVCLKSISNKYTDLHLLSLLTPGQDNWDIDCGIPSHSVSLCPDFPLVHTKLGFHFDIVCEMFRWSNFVTRLLQFFKTSCFESENAENVTCWLLSLYNPTQDFFSPDRNRYPGLLDSNQQILTSLAVFIGISPWAVSLCFRSSFIQYYLWALLREEKKKLVSPCNPRSSHVMSPSWQEHHRFGILLGSRKAIKMWRKRFKARIREEKKWQWDGRCGEVSFGGKPRVAVDTDCGAPCTKWMGSGL